MIAHPKFKDWDTSEKIDRLCAYMANLPKEDINELSKVGAVRMSRKEVLEYIHHDGQHEGIPNEDGHLWEWGQTILPGIHHVRGDGYEQLWHGTGIVHQRCRSHLDEPDNERKHDE
eukprot:12615712-Heterocapsa_arctica.AAC.1